MHSSTYPTSPSLPFYFRISKFETSYLTNAGHTCIPSGVLPRVRLHMPLQLIISWERLEAYLTRALRFWQVDLLMLGQVRGLGEAGVAAMEVAFKRLLFGVFGAVVHCL